MGNVSRVFNPTTGYGVVDAGGNTHNRSWSLANAKSGKVGLSIYVFLASEKETIQADLKYIILIIRLLRRFILIR